MSATDELRKLLDERGVEWSKPNDVIMDIDGGIGSKITYWGDDWQYCAIENYCGHLSLSDLTPEQAITATLGRGTCHMEQIPECRYDDIECNECGVCLWGFFMDKPGEGVCSMPNYCPYCGRAVEQ